MYETVNEAVIATVIEHRNYHNYFTVIRLLSLIFVESRMGRRIGIFNGVHCHFGGSWECLEISIHGLRKRRGSLSDTVHHHSDTGRKTILLLRGSSGPVHQ